MWEGTGKRFKWYSIHVNFETKLSEVREPEEVSLAWNFAFRIRSHCYKWF